MTKRRSRAQAHTEKPWSRTIEHTLTQFGYDWNHVYPLMTKYGWRTGTTAKGFPDYQAFRDEWVLCIELKGETTPIEDLQIAWLMRHAAAHIPAWVLRPQDDWESIVDWIRHPGDSPLTFGWEPLAPEHPDYPLHPKGIR